MLHKQLQLEVYLQQKLKDRMRKDKKMKDGKILGDPDGTPLEFN